MSRRRGMLGAALAATVAGGVSWAAGRWLASDPPGGRQRWERTNHRGGTVTLAAGPAVALGAAAGVAIAPGVSRRVRAAGILTSLAVGTVGLYDD
ncbi:MAG: hypothetical protein ACRDVZ_17690, partial [Jiangellaceae bacterium]